MGARKRTVYVTVGGQTFAPDEEISADLAKTIDNPKVWGDTDTAADDDDTDVPYAKRKKADLEALVAERNAQRGEDDQIVVGGTGKVSDLADALDADDAAQSES